MKNITERKQESRLRLTSTAHEREALKNYNSDRNRSYQRVNTENHATRSQDVLRALANSPNKFMLWGQVRRLARGIHKPSEALTSVSISKAFLMINAARVAMPASSTSSATRAKMAAA